MFNGTDIAGRLLRGRGVAGLNMALAVVCVLLSLLIARDMINAKGSARQQAEVAQPADTKTSQLYSNRPLGAYAPIVEKNTFGLPAEGFRPLKSGTIQPGPQAAGASINGLILLGAVAWPGGYGYAIVLSSDGAQEVYRTGQEIPGAGTVERVEPGRVIVKVGGERKELALSMPSDAGLSGPATSEAASGGAGMVRQTAEGEFVVNRRAIDASIDNPQRILTDARLLPYMKDGVQEGFIISEINPRGIYRELGLQNGDVLVGVNKLRLSNPETALQAFTALRGMNRVELELIREGGRKLLTYTMR